MRFNILSTIRTNNFNDPQVIEKIVKVWEEAKPQLEKHNSSVFGIYHHYASDYKGDYSLSIAIEDGNTNSSIEIPNEKYEIFQVDTTDEQGIINTWNKIWNLEEEGTLARVYSYDFEKYNPNGEIEIHIAVK